MAPPPPAGPPAVLLAFFRWYCDPANAEDIEGDLLESFYRNVERFGQRKARRLFIGEIVLLLRPSLAKNPLHSIHFNTTYMRKSDWTWLVIIHLLLVTMAVSPFLPGPPNRLVVGLSAFAQAMTYLGAILAPAGVLWLILDFRQQKGVPGSHRRVLASIAAGVLMIPSLLGLIYSYMLIGVGAGIAASVVLGMSCYYLWKGVRRIRTQSRPFGFVPVCLLTVPGLSFLLHMYVIGPVSAYSRGLAMDRGEVLIGLVEEFKMEKGRYPTTLKELERALSVELPDSPVMGISGLKYSVDQQGFNVSFSQWQHMAVDEEIVLFSKESVAGQDWLGFDYKLDKYRVKGAYASFDTNRAHWRYYWCD